MSMSFLDMVTDGVLSQSLHRLYSSTGALSWIKIKLGFFGIIIISQHPISVVVTYKTCLS